MDELEKILDWSRGGNAIVNDLMKKSTTPPAWEKLKEELYAKKHKIAGDDSGRSDVIHDDGTIDEAAQIPIGLEELLVNRINQFMHTIPVKREYQDIDDNEVRQKIATAIERIYEEADIDTVNMERGLAYFAACEMFTLWYAVKKENDLYGFHSDYKLKCKVYSPMNDDVVLYPLMDEMDDMLAMSFYYKKTVGDKELEFFETYTRDRKYKWCKGEGDGEWQQVILYEDAEGNVTYGDEIVILKIPGVYAWRKRKTWKQGSSELREDVEYTHSRDSDVIAWNATPILKIAGQLQGDEDKGESRRIFRVENTGDVSYVSWDQSNDANKNHIDRSLSFFWQINQMADISVEKMIELNSIGYDARMTIFIDVFLKIGEESKPLLQAYRREGNVIKAFLKVMSDDPEWEKEVDNVRIKHVITPYIPKDEMQEIEKRLKANGGKAIESHLESIIRYGKSKDPVKTLEQIQHEETTEAKSTLSSLFQEGAV